MVHCSYSWALARKLLARFELVVRGWCTEVERGRGWRAEGFLVTGGAVSRVIEHNSVTKKDGKR